MDTDALQEVEEGDFSRLLARFKVWASSSTIARSHGRESSGMPSSIAPPNGPRAPKAKPTCNSSVVAFLMAAPRDCRRATLVGFYQPSKSMDKLGGDEMMLGELGIEDE